jgi:ABC-type sugar transport system ATPase subunit
MLSIRNISKSFPGVKALDDVNVEIDGGEVHALVGENGAGKTTLMNVIMGILQPDSGSMFIDNKEVQINHPIDALGQGISMIFQEVNLISTLSTAENVFIGKLPRKKKSSLVDWNRLYTETKDVLEKVGIKISPKEKVLNLSVGQQQMIQLAKAISSSPKIIIMDEPTASLSGTETETLFDIIKELKSQGKSVIYISHRLEEIFEIADRVTVLRDGKVIDTVSAKDVTRDDLISLMVGRYMDKMYKKAKRVLGDTVLSVKHLCKEGNFEDVSFDLKSGEILGIYGLVGAGRTEMALSIYRAFSYTSGEIYIEGKKVRIKSPEDAIRQGIMYLPEERKEQSIIPLMSIKENITISNLRDYSNFIFPVLAREREISEKYVNRLKIKITSLNQQVLNLSGGNQQKVTFSRLLALKPKIMILDEPTKGIDVGAKAEIHAIIEELAESGIGVIVISSELPEVMAISDKIMVMCLGKVTGVFPSSGELTQEDLLKAACMQ